MSKINDIFSRFEAEIDSQAGWAGINIDSSEEFGAPAVRSSGIV